MWWGGDERAQATLDVIERVSGVYCNGKKIALRLEYLKGGSWIKAEAACGVQEEGIRVRLELLPGAEDYVTYSLSAEAAEPTQVRLSAAPEETGECYHVIPCCIYGDNNAGEVHAGEFPLLCEEKDGCEDVFRAARWEFRADRAATPLSAVCTKEGVLAITAEPYAEAEGVQTENTAKDADGFLRNGLFAELPNRCGVSLGYTNDPVSFVNKRRPETSTRELARKAAVTGRIYYERAEDPAEPRQALHRIVRQEYALRHKRPEYRKSFREAVEGCMRSLLTISWDSQAGEYTNCNCLPPANPELHPWRNVKEIGWTGGCAQRILRSCRGRGEGVQ